jgi:hypothetical protein
MDKYKKTELPTKADALLMADEYQAWAIDARENDKPGSARQFELMVLLLRFYGQSGEK